MSKLLLLFLIIFSLMFLSNTAKVLAQEGPTSCPIDTTKGEFFCVEGVCFSQYYDCINYQACYRDFYKDDSTGCEFEPKTPESHCDSSRVCIPPDGPPTCIGAGGGGCPTGFDCRNGIGSACVITSTSPIPPLQSCIFDRSNPQSTCPSGMECDANNIRTNGYCVQPVPTVPVCNIDSDCPAGQKCQTAGSFTTKRCVVVIPTGPGATAGGIPCDNNTGFQTAIGCIHTSPVALVKDFLKFGLGIGGGLAFLMMLLGVFQMLTSAGNPETLAAGKDRLTSAIIGLLFVIFSVLLMQIIGVDILGLGQQFGL